MIASRHETHPVATPRPASRRQLLAGFVSGVVAGIGREAEPTAARRHKKRCRFAQSGSTQTLLGNCAITRPLALAPGATLDGGGFAIAAKGSASAYPDGAIVVAGGSGHVRNLTLDGRGVRRPTGHEVVSGIVFASAGGTVSDLELRNFAGYGVRAFGATSASVDVSNSWLSACDQGVDFSGASLTATLTGGGIDCQFTAVTVDGPLATIDGVAIAGRIGVGVSDGSKATVRNCALTVGQYGVVTISANPGNRADTTVTDCRIDGPGSLNDETYGIAFATSTGFVDGNTISGFTSSAGDHGCGIRVDGGSSVTIGGHNTFPNPPGNQHDVC